MCLFSKRKSPHVLKRDRRCWKVLYHKDAGKLVSVVQGKEYEPGRLYTEVGEPEVVASKHSREYYRVGGGYMHAFTSSDAAELDREIEHTDHDWRLVVCECTIPAGTEVYSNRRDREICARSLRIDRIV